MNRPRVLLDENIPRRLKFRLTDQCDVATVQEQGWSGVKNGKLLGLAEAEFSVFVTMDRGISYQHTISTRDISMVLLRAKSNRFADLLPLTGSIIAAIIEVQVGEIVVVSG